MCFASVPNVITRSTPSRAAVAPIARCASTRDRPQLEHIAKHGNRLSARSQRDQCCERRFHRSRVRIITVSEHGPSVDLLELRTHGNRHKIIEAVLHGIEGHAHRERGRGGGQGIIDIVLSHGPQPHVRPWSRPTAIVNSVKSLSCRMPDARTSALFVDAERKDASAELLFQRIEVAIIGIQHRRRRRTSGGRTALPLPAPPCPCS